jgi:phage terminase small subunit
MTDLRKLTVRQERFVKEYLRDGNAARAARDAGYSAAKSGTQGWRMLRRPQIEAAVAAEREEISRKLSISTERVIAEYVRIGFADMRKIFDANGNLLHPRFMDDDTAAAIAEVEVSRKAGGETLHKVKRVDKKGALDSLARVLGLFRDKPDGGEADNLAERLDAARKRVLG